MRGGSQARRLANFERDDIFSSISPSSQKNTSRHHHWPQNDDIATPTALSLPQGRTLLNEHILAVSALQNGSLCSDSSASICYSPCREDAARYAFSYVLFFSVVQKKHATCLSDSLYNHDHCFVCTSTLAFELQMRKSSARLRIVQKLSGGAHLLLPGSETTIAIRTYFAQDLNGDDGLVAFRNAFKYPICFFILPPEAQLEQLSNIHSFVNQAQLIMNNQDGSGGGQTVRMVLCVTTTCLHDTYDTLIAGLCTQDGAGRVFIVPDVASAITILSSVVQALTPASRNLKKQYHHSVKSKNFVGDNTSSSKAAAIMHVATAFRNWANRFELPVGEADVLMSRFGSISGIGTAELNAAPLYDSTKDKLHSFFGSHHHGRRQMQEQPVHGGMSHQFKNPQETQVPMEMQQIYSVSAPYRGTMNDMSAGQFQPQQLSYEYQTPPRDSMVGMVPVDEGDMEFSQFETSAWQQEPHAGYARATPGLVSGQFVPRQQHAVHPMQIYNPSGPPPVHNNGPRRLLPQFSHPMGNPIRPFSSYSTASESRADGVTDYYR